MAIGPGWHADALARLLDGIPRRARLVRALLARDAWNAAMVVFGESDTVAHHFWRFHDPRSPRHAPGSGFEDAIAHVYAALDDAVGTLVAAVPADTTIAVVSDHGSGGASDRVVHLNRRLAEAGLLRFRAPGPHARVAAALRAAALAAIPTRFQGAILRRLPGAAGRFEGLARFGAVDWAGTVAYSEELDYHPSVWLNVRGRDPEGTVAPADYERVRARVARALADWTHDEGRPVVRRVWRREELYAGPAVDEAPDLLLEMEPIDGYSPSCLRSDGPGPALRRLAPAEVGGGKGRGMNGTHRRDGLFLFAGPRVAGTGELPDAEIVDALPTLLALADLDVPEGLDGRPIAGALARAPRWAADAVAAPERAAVELDAAASRDLTGRLVALGYLEPDA
jgi:predicted AlkP superfamily phosphohydrolase/phosphomutase